MLIGEISPAFIDENKMGDEWLHIRLAALLRALRKQCARAANKISIKLTSVDCSVFHQIIIVSNNICASGIFPMTHILEDLE